MTIEGLLLDIDGVLAISWEPIAGAGDALARLRDEGIPFRLVTNTTTRTRRNLAATLTGAGIPVEPEEIITAPVGTAAYLRAHHLGARCLLISDGDAREDLEGVELVTADADVVVFGGAGDDLSYATMNHAFRLLMEGASLVAMHKNLFWRTAEGFQLDGGAYVHALEAAAGVEAVVCGKPSKAFFDSALELVGTPADRTAMVGDDIVNDVLGAQAAGLTGVLVRTGKFRDEDLERSDGSPDMVVDSIADVPGLPDLGPAA